MSIHSASAATLNALQLAKASIAQQTLYATAKMLAAPIGEKRDEVRNSLFPGLFQAIPDPRNPQVIDAVKAPYGTCQIFVPQESDVCFVTGDIHGDLESLVACADRALSECADGGVCAGRRPILFILGDLIDRGPNSAECIAFVLRLALGKDEQRQDLRVLLVRGDHDVALNCLSDGRITASVSPADFADRFAEDESGDSLCSADAFLARAFARFVQLCSPASALLPNGILMAHGAVPHSDLQARLGMDLTLWSTPCAQDFSWCRLRTDKPSKAPNRYSKTSEMGVTNFSDFIEKLNGLSMFRSKGGLPCSLAPVSIFLNGHEHCEGGYKACPVPLSAGSCMVHNVSSFTDRNLADEVTTPSFMLRLEARGVVPIPMAQIGARWQDGTFNESQTASAEEKAPQSNGQQENAMQTAQVEEPVQETGTQVEVPNPGGKEEAPDGASEQPSPSEPIPAVDSSANTSGASAAPKEEVPQTMVGKISSWLLG